MRLSHFRLLGALTLIILFGCDSSTTTVKTPTERGTSFTADADECLDWLLLDEGFNCLGLVPECWTRVAIDFEGEIAVEQPTALDGGPPVRSVQRLDEADLELVRGLMCESALRTLLSAPGDCSETRCTGVIVVLEGGDGSGTELRDPIAGPCVCTDETHPYSRTYALFVDVLLPRYFPNVKHPFHIY